MRAVIQRAKNAAVAVDNKTVGAIKSGLLVLLCVMEGDNEACAEVMAKKTANLRIFNDSEGKMNLSPLDLGLDMLVVSQFTLCADCKKGSRPSFSSSAEPIRAEGLYKYYIERLKAEGAKRVESGVFAAHMDVSLVNDGPVTIIFDSDVWIKP